MKKEAFRVVIVGVAASFACAAPRMQVPPDIAAGSGVIEVTERSAWSGSLADESFRLGPYAVENVDRDWNSSSGFSVGGFSKEATAGGYAFAFTGDGAKLAGQCASAKRENAFDLGKGLGLEFQFSKLACSCARGDERATVVVSGKGDQFEGELSLGPAKYAVASVHEVEGGSSQSTPTGYRVDGESPIGAAEVLHPGRVFLDKELSSARKAELSCLFAGLMLYKPPKDD